MRERKPILNPKLRYEDVAFIRETYGLRAALFFPAHRIGASHPHVSHSRRGLRNAASHLEGAKNPLALGKAHAHSLSE